MKKNKDIGVIILVGGYGTRLQSVISDRPKVLAPIGDKTLLDHIIDNLIQSGFNDIVLSVGYMKEKIYDHIKKRTIPVGITIKFSSEEKPLGTGGAIKQGMKMSAHDIYLVLNGDTLFPIDYHHFINLHKKHSADISISLKEIDDTNQYGRIHTDAINRVVSFSEKGNQGNCGLINAGAYIFNKNVFDKLSLPKSFSIEKDFFEKYFDRLNIFGFLFTDYFVDIGTPENYNKALKKHKIDLNKKL